MDFNRSVLCFYLVAMCVTKSQGKFALILDSVTYEYNAAYLSYVNASITPDKCGINAELKCPYDICDYTAAIAVQVPQLQKQNVMNILNVKTKIRDFIKGTDNNLLKLVHDALTKYSNAPKKCPVPSNFVWRFNNYSINLEKVPLILTNFHFICNLRVTRPNSEQVLNGYLKGRIECKTHKGLGCQTGFKRG